MEQATSFEQQWKKNQRKKTTRTVIVLIVVLAVAALAVYGYMASKNTASADAGSSLTYRVERVNAGSVQTTISASGPLSPITLTEQAAEVAGEVLAVNCAVGDTVEKGDLLVQLDDPAYITERDTILSSLDSVNRSLTNTSETVSTKKLLAGYDGRVKDVQIQPGDSLDNVMERVGYLMLISTDGRMQVVVDTRAAKKDDIVSVRVGEEEISGVVASVDKVNNTATVIIERNDYTIGTAVVVTAADGNVLGAGSLQLREFIRVTGTDGTVESVSVEENQKVSKSKVVALRVDKMKATRYASYETERDTLIAQLRTLNEQYNIVAEESGTIMEVSVSVGDDIVAEAALFAIQAPGGYTINLSVDELDISTVSMSQPATVTMDAVGGIFSGEVTAISHKSDDSSGVARYTVEISVPDIPGALPGMNADCVIVTADSGPGLMVRAEAVQFDFETGEQYLMVAPAGSVFGQTTNLEPIYTRVVVETGMSDGLFLIVTGDVQDEMLIYVPVLETNSIYSAFGGMSGRPMQMMGGGGENVTFITRSEPVGGARIGGGMGGGGMRP